MFLIFTFAVLERQLELKGQEVDVRWRRRGGEEERRRREEEEKRRPHRRAAEKNVCVSSLDLEGCCHYRLVHSQHPPLLSDQREDEGEEEELETV